MLNSLSVPFDPLVLVSFLKRQLSLKEVYQAFLCEQIVEQTAKGRNVTVEPEEIQALVNQDRYENCLISEAEFSNWLTDQMITLNDWQAGIRGRLLAKKLAKDLFGPEVENTFNQRQSDFEQVLLYRIMVPYERTAHDLLYQIVENEISFYEAAHLYDTDERRRLQCGYEGKRYRYSLESEVAEAILKARPEEIVGPVRSLDNGYNLLMVEEFIPAQLSDEVYETLLNQLFSEWLLEQLRRYTES